MEEKVLEGEVMTEKELEKSRCERAVFDFLLSPAGMEFVCKNALFSFLSDRRRD